MRQARAWPADVGHLDCKASDFARWDFARWDFARWDFGPLRLAGNFGND
jgi:hypothetical protein